MNSKQKAFLDELAKLCKRHNVVYIGVSSINEVLLTGGDGHQICFEEYTTKSVHDNNGLGTFKRVTTDENYEVDPD